MSVPPNERDGAIGLGSPARSAATLGALWLLVFTAASQTIIITPILPVIGDELAVDEKWLGTLVQVYSWALAVAALFMGPVSDRIGRRRVLLIGAGAMSVALGLHALATSFQTLLAARLLAGLCGGMLSGAAVSYVGDAVPYERRGWATGVVMSGIPVGLVLGVPVGRVLAAGLGFRVPFEAFAVLMALVFVLVLTVVPQPRVRLEETRLDLTEFIKGYSRLLREPDNVAAALTYFLMYLGLGLLIAYLPIWISQSYPLEVSLFGEPLTFFGLPIDFIATLFSVGGLASVFIGPWAGSLSDRAGRKPMILVSCIGLGVVTLALTYVVQERWVLYLVYIAIMGFFALRASPLQALLTALVPGRQRGTLMSLVIAVGQIGTGAGAFAAGFLYEIWGYRSLTFASASTVLLLAYVVWRYLPEPTAQAVDPVKAPVPIDP